MANTNINIRMDADLKRQFEAFCADMGMTMTTLLTWTEQSTRYVTRKSSISSSN